MRVVVYSFPCYNPNMNKKIVLPTSIKFEEQEYSNYKNLADQLGIPVGTFMKMVLKQYSDQLFENITGTKVTLKSDKSQ
jgi:hypothetical protein